MPKALEDKLKRKAKALGLGKERTGAYVYGTMNKLGVMDNSPRMPAPKGHKTHPRGG